MSQTINRLSPTPYYEQLFGILRDRIVSGTYPLDERLPSEHDLCREFGLSRATVRQTLSKLESAGYARRVARRGVFATVPTEPSGWVVQELEGFLESQLRHGRTGIDTRVLSAGHIDPPPHVVEALRLGADEQVFALERVRLLQGEPVLCSTNWFPERSAHIITASQEVLSGAASVNAALFAAGCVTEGARRIIHALPAPDDIAARLGVDVGRPLLRIRSQSWDREDQRFDYYETWLITDLVPLEVVISAG